MASNFENPASWALRTPGGIPYKLLKMSGEFEMSNGGGTAEVIIVSTDLIAFCTELLPSVFTIGSVSIPIYKRFQNVNLAVLKIGFDHFSDDLPIDPFLADPAAPPGTYYPVIKCTVHFGLPSSSSNTSDATTYIEVTADATGEYIHNPPTNTKSQPMKSTGPTDAPTTNGSPNKVRVPVLPHTILVPQTQWNLTWKLIPKPIFTDIIEPRLDLLMGRVNSAEFSITHVSIPETLLFAGYNHKYSYTWRGHDWDTPYVELTLKIIEKRVVDHNDIVRGHNDFWRPGYGWDRLLINDQPTYQSHDFNILFD